MNGWCTDGEDERGEWGTSHKERRSGMERSARGGERASIAILHRTEIDTGTAGVTGVPGGRAGLPAGGFCIFRESITNSSANISGAWLSAMPRDLRDSFRRGSSHASSSTLLPSPFGYRISPKLILDASERVDASRINIAERGKVYL